MLAAKYYFYPISNTLSRWRGIDDNLTDPSIDTKALIVSGKTLKHLVVSESQAKEMVVPVFAVRGGDEDDPADTVERLVNANPSVKYLRLETEDHVSTLNSIEFRSALWSFLRTQEK